MLALNKTKAALQSCPCSDQKLKLNQNTRLIEGGQSFTRHNFAPADFIQVFGSMPRCCSSLRIMRLIHAANDSSPSCCCAVSINSRSSGSSLNWNGGLPRLSFLCVDTSITPDVLCLCVMTHYIHDTQKATPRGAGTLPRRLTKPLIGVTVMADQQHTQTHPKFTWRFLALNRHDIKAKPCRLSVEAATEREARRILAPHFILSLAARVPVLEVLHA